MATKRDDGSGSITTRKRDGALLVRVRDDSLPSKRRAKIVTRGRRPDGRPESATAHRRRAEQELAKLLAEVARPTTLRQGDVLSVERYAREHYLPTLDERKPATRDSYRRHLECWVFPILGQIELTALTVQDVDDHDRALRDPKRVRGPLRVGSRRHARGVLSRVLAQAKRHGYIERNPCVDARRIRAESRDRFKDVLSPTEVRSFLAAAKATRWELPVALLGLLGLRSSEVLGLSWDDVDTETGTVTVRRGLVALSGGCVSLGASPKNAGSVRTLEIGPDLVALLRARRVAQNEHRLACGPLWQAHATDEAGERVALVHTDEAGRPLPPHRLSDAVERIAIAGGIERHVHPHLLRHSVASVMLSEGHDIAAVAATLGHASAATTAAVYSHALRTNRVRATAAMSDAVGSW